MQRIDGRFIYSASDLNNFLECEHLSGLDRRAALGQIVRPPARDGQAEILAELGEAHERSYLQRIIDEGKQVVMIERGASVAGKRAAAQATADAMRAGAAIVYQACFFDDTWLGYADFLRRVEVRSQLGSWGYEVADTKLSRHTEPYFILQLCFYSERVGRIQGRLPDQMHVILGHGIEESFRVKDYSAYYRATEARFLERMSVKQDEPPYPYPTEHCGICVWDAQCTKKRVADDHLSLVAGIRRLQTARLNDSGIGTLEALSKSTAEQRPTTMNRTTYEKLARQARLQFEQRVALAAKQPNPYKYEILPIDPQSLDKRGFALIPPPSTGDIFFDMEGYPFYGLGEGGTDSGLEYLFGAYTRNDNRFTKFWGCDRDQRLLGKDRLAERRAFEQFIDWVMERRSAFPDLHIYHYASYEKIALQKLAQRHGTREEQVDTILAEQLLIDLYRVVKQTICVGQPGYGIKKLEAFYMTREAAAITAGDQSVVEFERWLRNRHDPTRREDQILEDIEQYNRLDCESTYYLREWLLHLKNEAARKFGIEIPFRDEKARADDDKPADPRDPQRADLKARLIADIPEEFEPADLDRLPQRLGMQWRLAQMLDYHWRELRPVYWEFHDRCDRYQDGPLDLLDDPDALVGLEPVGEPVRVQNSLGYTMSYPPQQHKMKAGERYHDPQTKRWAGEIIEIDDETGTLKLKRGPSLEDSALPKALVPLKVVRAGAIERSLARLAEAALAGAPENGHYRAAFDLLNGNDPRLRDRGCGLRVQPQELDADKDIQPLVDALDESYLFIQGPPGSGKTYAGSHLIVNLLKRGHRVGVAANSHAAIRNLLKKIEQVARAQNVSFRGIHKFTGAEHPYISAYGDPLIVAEKGNDRVPRPEINLYAGTAWLFSREEMDGQLDYLFIEEAGQVSLPNAAAMATSAKNVVLLGDPLQLAQVSHMSHLGNIGASVLEHLLAGRQTVAEDRGVFLATTYRMHPDLCGFISEIMYEGRLHSAPGCAAQRVDSLGLTGSGPRYIGVDHTGNRQSSTEEAECIADQIQELLRGTITDVDGKTRPLIASDLLVVTPYNAQVACIKKSIRDHCLPEVAVGTVDKFQGQEAYVVFYSLAASDSEDAARGIDFIFNRNRLNVAVSRARSISVLVGSSELWRTGGRGLNQMLMLNGVDRYLELA